MVSQVTKGEKNICPICGKENINIWAEGGGAIIRSFFAMDVNLVEYFMPILIGIINTLHKDKIPMAMI